MQNSKIAFLRTTLIYRFCFKYHRIQSESDSSLSMGDYLAWILHAHAHLTVCVGNWFAPFRPTDSLNIGRRYGKQVYTLKIITIPEYFKPTFTVLHVLVRVHVLGSPHLVVERMEELIERKSLEESGWCQRER